MYKYKKLLNQDFVPQIDALCVRKQILESNHDVYKVYGRAINNWYSRNIYKKVLI